VPGQLEPGVWVLISLVLFILPIFKESKQAYCAWALMARAVYLVPKNTLNDALRAAEDGLEFIIT
jgi:hypothetical protein